MNSIKTATLISLMTISLGGTVVPAFAEEAVTHPQNTASVSSATINETITHIDSAIVEIKKSDFAASYLHLKAARATGAQIVGNEETVKKANMLVIQGQITSKKGEINQSVELLNQALQLYKSL